MLAQSVQTKDARVRCRFCGVPYATETADVACEECGIVPIAPPCESDERGETDDWGPELQASTKDEAIRELVSNLAAGNGIAVGDVESVVAAVQRRENLTTTGIGNGIAIPHVRHEAAAQLVGIVARSSAGIDFGSFDGRAVHRLILLITPPNRPKEHLRALAAISQNLRAQGFSNQEKQWRHGDD